MNKLKSNTFKARVNVNFSTSILVHSDLKKILEDKMSELDVLDPTGVKRQIPTTLAYQSFSCGEEIIFGDELEYISTDDQFRITVYPKKMFEIQSKRFVDMPCKLRGNVVETFNNAYKPLPDDEKRSMEAKFKDLTARYHKTPVMSLVA